MLTTDGSSFCTNLGMLNPLGSTAAAGVVLTSLIVTPGVEEEPGEAK